MKKLLSLLTAIGILSAFCIYAGAFEIKYYSAEVPVITDCSAAKENGDVIYSVTYTSGIKNIELLREFMADTAADKYGSEEKLLSSPEAYLCEKTYNTLEISTDGESWMTYSALTEIPARLCLYSELIPFLRNNGTDISTLTEGAVIYIRVLTASENHADENTRTVFVYAPSEPFEMVIEPFGFVHYIIPDGVTLPDGLPTFFTEDIAEDIPLPIPEREGYIFDGWSADGSTRTGIIPKGTRALTLTSHWIPMVYEVNYKITTRFGYMFGKADNSNNPYEYTVGSEELIYDIVSPVPGFTFDGWYLTEDFSGERVTSIPEGTTGDILLYAKWISDEEIEEMKRLAREEYMKERMFGDLDSDGKITAADARYVLRAVVGLEEPDMELLRRADYSGSNKITANEARTTLRVAVGLDDLYEILLENGVFPQ